jgi:hypothetical protein
MQKSVISFDAVKFKRGSLICLAQWMNVVNDDEHDPAAGIPNDGHGHLAHPKQHYRHPNSRGNHTAKPLHIQLPTTNPSAHGKFITTENNVKEDTEEWFFCALHPSATLRVVFNNSTATVVPFSSRLRRTNPTASHYRSPPSRSRNCTWEKQGQGSFFNQDIYTRKLRMKFTDAGTDNSPSEKGDSS